MSFQNVLQSISFSSSFLSKKQYFIAFWWHIKPTSNLTYHILPYPPYPWLNTIPYPSCYQHTTVTYKSRVYLLPIINTIHLTLTLTVPLTLWTQKWHTSREWRTQSGRTTSHGSRYRGVQIDGWKSSVRKGSRWWLPIATKNMLTWYTLMIYP